MNSSNLGETLNRNLRKSLLALAVAAVVAGCAGGPEPRDEEMARKQAEQEQMEARQQAAKEEQQREAAARRAEAQRQAAQREAEQEERREAARKAQMEREAEAQRRAEMAERRAAQQQAEEKAAAEAEAKAEAERLAEQRAAEQRQAEQERREAERMAAAQAEQERRAAEQERQAEAQRLAEQRAQAQREAAEQEAAERRAREEAVAQTAPTSTQAVPKSNQAGAAGSEGYRCDLDRPAASEIARLGNDLTAVGAIRAGNADGTIPAWNGGITSAPAGYSVGMHHPDPFASDKVLFTIDQSNYQEYRDRLSVGQIAMFERYDTYRMPVYQTRRSASFPQRTYETTMQNARTGALTADCEGVTNVSEGFPFPIPKNGPQLIWNHKMKYKGVGAVRYNNQVAPTSSGAYTVIRLREEILGLYYKPGTDIADINNILFYFYQLVEGPARLAGNVLLTHETLNQSVQPRQVWIYNPGQRRVRRAPNVAYDNPGTASDGLRTNDMLDMFNGSLDRYTWTLQGKREMYVPYNSYKAHSDSVSYDDLVQPGHLNPDLMRYELHRVWVVDANLKEGVRHINPRRTFYIDEDSYQIMMVDHYDRQGNIWRASEAHSINYYEVPTFWSTIEVHNDLQAGRYLAVGLDNQEQVNDFNFQAVPADFTPQSLRTRGRR